MAAAVDAGEQAPLGVVIGLTEVNNDQLEAYMKATNFVDHPTPKQNEIVRQLREALGTNGLKQGWDTYEYQPIIRGRERCFAKIFCCKGVCHWLKTRYNHIINWKADLEQAAIDASFAVDVGNDIVVIHVPCRFPCMEFKECLKNRDGKRDCRAHNVVRFCARHHGPCKLVYLARRVAIKDNIQHWKLFFGLDLSSRRDSKLWGRVRRHLLSDTAYNVGLPLNRSQDHNLKEYRKQHLHSKFCFDIVPARPAPMGDISTSRHPMASPSLLYHNDRLAARSDSAGSADSGPSSDSSEIDMV